MAIVAKIKLDGKEPGYELKECEYEFYQPVDKNNKPCANPKGGIIKFTILAPSEEDPTFHKWMFSKTDVKYGVIEFDISVGAEQKRKILQFEQAHCIGLKEVFDITQTDSAYTDNRHPVKTSEQMLTQITISAAVIDFGGKGTTFTNNELLV